ncbi:MAG TPA: 23S rRNA (guanosine(2251)-2'-O)-methyltransferase RlmB [Bacillota bacterium]|nr:23S rRNA (guanosine(2251)-2'-O)-methyltransferase RlmB [Bacillota bacterium]
MKSKSGRAAPEPEELVYGRQSVLEALKYQRLHQVYVLEGQRGAVINDIVSLARQKRVPLAFVSPNEFKALVNEVQGHQGVAALSPPFRYLTFDQLIQSARADSQAPFFLLLDHLQDPQNFGSIIRTADAAGLDGLIIPRPRAVKVTPAVRKVAAGAVERIRIALVNNLARAIEQLKQEGFWIYGAEADGEEPYYNLDYSGPLALVVGSEGRGLSRLVRRHCDRTVYIPMQEKAASLNVAVASAVLVYAALARRQGWGN